MKKTVGISTRSEEVREFRRNQQIENNNPFWQWPGPSRGTKKPLWKYLKAGDWQDQPCFIIGGGPSLIGFDFEQLKKIKDEERQNGTDCRIIAVNKAFMFTPWADMMFAMDTDFYTGIISDKLGAKAKLAFQQFNGWKVWVDSNNYTYDDIHYLFRWRLPEITRDLKKGVWVGNNSGTGAIMLAASLGCNPIYLLGFDGSHKGGRSHFHSGYPRGQMPKTVKGFIKYFDKIRKPLKDAGFFVYNLNPESAIQAFPKKSFDEVFS